MDTPDGGSPGVCFDVCTRCVASQETAPGARRCPVTASSTPLWACPVIGSPWIRTKEMPPAFNVMVSPEGAVSVHPQANIAEGSEDRERLLMECGHTAQEAACSEVFLHALQLDVGQRAKRLVGGEEGRRRPCPWPWRRRLCATNWRMTCVRERSRW